MSRIGVCGLVIAVMAILGSAYALTRGSNPGPSRPGAGPPTGPLRVVLGERSPASHDAGRVPRGGRWEVPFLLSNPGPGAVTVGPARTSCDCLRVELDANRVEVGTEVGGRAVIDLSHEPGFAGGLMLDAELPVEETGRRVFALKLSVEVR